METLREKSYLTQRSYVSNIQTYDEVVRDNQSRRSDVKYLSEESFEEKSPEIFAHLAKREEE